MRPSQSRKPTAPTQGNFSVFATDPSTSSRCPAYAPASASILFPAFRFAAERRDFPSAIRVFALTHSRRIAFQRYPWLISLTRDLPDSLALSGLPVHPAASQLAVFSLGRVHAYYVASDTQIALRSKARKSKL
jgi:hypothetical protein